MLRRAIAEQRLRVHYQPIIDLRSGYPVSAEALVRIFDPELGMLSPDSFLEVAEETGLLVTIDERVLAAAVQQATRWRARFADTGFSGVSVNITGRHRRRRQPGSRADTGDLLGPLGCRRRGR